MFDRLDLKIEDGLLVIGKIEIKDEESLKKVRRSSKYEDWPSNNEVKKFNKAIVDLYSVSLDRSLKKLIGSQFERSLLVLPVEKAYELAARPESEYFSRNTIFIKLFYEIGDLIKENGTSYLFIKERKHLSFKDKVAQHLLLHPENKVRETLKAGLKKHYKSLFNTGLSPKELEEIIDELELRESILDKNIKELTKKELLDLVQVIYGAQFYEK